jgi:hypothetical protein
MMQRLKTIDSGARAARPRKLFFLFLVLLGSLFPDSVPHSRGAGEQGHFFVTGHVRPLLKENEEVGVVEGFLEKGVPFINSIHPNFVVFTGDVVLGCIDGFHRLPVETIKKQYAFFAEQVLGKIEAKSYCVAGNHDTGSVPHAPSIELFETLLNPLHFSFRHKGSLFLFLSIYEPFDHMPQNNNLAPLRAVWEEYDTAASRAFLDRVRGELSGNYDHIFVFVQASPCSDTPIGYYWTRFLIPLFSSTGKDVHVFSTEHFARRSLYRDAYKVVRHENIRFYNFAVFPRGGYLVYFDDSSVRVYLGEGEDFMPSVIQEVAYQPASRLSMLYRYLLIEPRRYFLFEIVIPLCETYNRVISALRNKVK